MRIRFKPWAREELETSPIYIDNPQKYKKKWKTVFEKDAPIHLELGCGKGSFIAKLSKINKEKNINYIAIDLVDAMLGLAKRNLELEYGIRTTLEKEEIDIKSLKRGECLIFVGENHILAEIKSFPFEERIINEKRRKQL